MRELRVRIPVHLKATSSYALYVIKHAGRADAELCTFLKTALEAAVGQRHAPAVLRPGKRTGAHCSVGLETGQDESAKHRLTGVQTPYPHNHSWSLCQLRYPFSRIRTPRNNTRAITVKQRVIYNTLRVSAQISHSHPFFLRSSSLKTVLELVTLNWPLQNPHHRTMRCCGSTSPSRNLL